MTALPAPRSLRTRVALVAVAVLAAWVLALLTAVNVLLGARLSGQADALLRTRAEAGAATVQVGPGGEVTVRDTVDDAAIDVGTWIFRGNTVLERPGPSAALDHQARLLVGRGRRFDRSGGSTGVRWYAVPVLHGHRQVGTVVTRLSFAPYRDIQQSALGATGAVSLLLLGGAFLAFRAAVSRALRPVESMTHQAARWSMGDVQRRFGRDRRPTELDDLASTLDALLDRVAAVLRHERQLSAEISHELRTPLSRIVAETDLLLAHPDGGTDVREGLVAVRASASEMDDILETLMTAARHESPATIGRCDVGEVVRSLAARRQQAHPRLRVQASGPLTAGLEAALLERALSPVLDNALRFARSRVDVHVAGLPGVVSVRVSDDGPGIPEEDLQRVFEPGYRGHGPDGHGGAGLGLALSRRLLAVADGTIRAEPAPLGAVLALTLPAD